MATQLALDPAIVTHIIAINSFDIDAVMDTFTDDALVNDVSREFRGTEHIRAWITREVVGCHVTLIPVEVEDNDGLYAVRCEYDGSYEKTNLPSPLLMTNYYRVRDGRIVTLFTIRNREPDYCP